MDDNAAATQFTANCAMIARMLADRDRDALSPVEERALFAAISSVTAELPRLLHRRSQLGGRDPQDIAQEALERFVRMASVGRVNPEGSPAGYLMTIAMNIVRTDARGAPEAIPVADIAPAGEADTDKVTRLLDQMASADDVRRALARAYRKGDHMAIDVVRAWLDLAHRLGEEPTSRAVAVEVGVSKSTVANVLARFRGYLEEGR
jgi:hypothetical protein